MLTNGSEMALAQHVALRNSVSVLIRPLSLDDGDRLGDFYEAIPREDYRFYCPHPLDRGHAYINAAKATNPHEAVLVAVTPESNITGYAWLRWHEHATQSGFGICIDRAFQGTGLGKVLMERLLEIAAHVGPPIITLTVQKANVKAAQLYQKMGFVITGEQLRGAFDEFPAEPEYRMQLVIRS